MGPIAFVLVFLVVPLAVALFAGAIFAAVALVRLLVAVPTAAWAGLAVAATVVLAARLGAVLHGMPARPEP